MQNYHITLCYDGTRYDGWQKQGNTENTIQQKLEQILTQIAGTPIEIFGSGRTDAGTHAKGQSANFHMNFVGTEQELFSMLNARLPEDIGILSLRKAAPRFHARLHAVSKTYIYTIWTGEIPPVFHRKYSFWCKEPLDITAMKTACTFLIGTHDFRSFCGNKRMKKSTIRTITEITFTQKDNRLMIAFTGNGFLYQMVRILTGTLIEIGEHKKQPQQIPEILNAKNREFAGFTAPAKGLCLYHVYYD